MKQRKYVICKYLQEAIDICSFPRAIFNRFGVYVKNDGGQQAKEAERPLCFVVRRLVRVGAPTRRETLGSLRQGRRLLDQIQRRPIRPSLLRKIRRSAQGLA